ncbi:flagellar hook-length control protein FliK [Nitrospinota bacterium]
MANIPFISFETAENIGGPTGAAPFPSGDGEGAFDSFLEEAGSAIEESFSDTDPSETGPQAQKKTDEAEVSSSSTSDSEEAVQEVEVTSGEDSGASGEVEDGGEGEAPAAGEQEEPQDGQTAEAGDQTERPALVPLIFVENLVAPRSAVQSGGEDVPEVAQAAVSPGTSGAGNGNLPRQTASAGGIAPAPAVRGGTALQSGISGQAGENHSAQAAPSSAGVSVEFSAPGSGIPESHSETTQTTQTTQAAPGPAPESAKAPGLTPIDLEGEINAAALKVAEAAEEVSAQPKPSAAPIQPKVDLAPADAAKQAAVSARDESQESRLASGNQAEGVIAPQADADEAILARAAGATKGEEAAVEELAAPQNGSQLETQEVVAAKAEVSSPKIEVKVDAQAPSQPTDSRAEAALKMRLQQQVLETAVSRINLALRDKVVQARIRLEPPSLGRMDMKLHVEAGTLNAKVTVESAWVKDAITSNLRELRSALQEHGLEVEQFSVDVDAGMDAWSSERGSEDESFADSLLFGSGAHEEELEAELAVTDGGTELSLAGDLNSVDLFA